MIALIFAVTGNVYVSSKPQDPNESTQDSEKSIPFKTLAEGVFSEHMDRKVYVIAKRSEWKSLWKVMFPKADESSVPSVDFDNKMLIAILRGGIGGQPYELSVTDVVKTKKGIKVFINEKMSGRGCASLPVFLLPYHIIELDKRSKEFRNNVELITELERSSFGVSCAAASMLIPEIIDLDLGQIPSNVAIKEASIAGDRLKLVASYSACDDQSYPTFNFVGALRTGASQPAQAVAVLLKDGPQCSTNTTVKEDLFFDLTPLKKKYQQSQGSTSGVIFLKVAGVDEALSYQF
jgi:hypothetical protein